MTNLIVNGRKTEFDGDEEMPLIWYLRENVSLKGTKFGCGIGSCGACTVHLNGSPVRSCVTPMQAIADGDRITTIEGLAARGDLHPVQQAWIDEDVPQCGYCQAGQIMAVAGFLDAYPNPTDDDIDAAVNNLCRCGTYNRIRKAIHRAASTAPKDSGHD